MARLLMFLVTAAAVSHASDPAPWKELAPLPRAVAGQAAALDGNTLWMAGGSYWEGGMKKIDDGIYRQVVGAGAWKRIGTIGSGFAHGGWAADAKSLWLVGGLGERGPSAVIRRIDFATGTVREVATLPEPRAYCGVALLDGILWVVGGMAIDGDYSHASPQCWRVDLRGDRPEIHALHAAGPAWINPVVMAFCGEVHVLPGSVWSVTHHRLEAPTDVWVYSPSIDRWKKHAIGVSLPRGLSGAALDTRRGIICGGAEEHEGVVNLGRGTWLYDANNWTVTVGPSLPSPRLAAAVVGDSTQAFVLGGESGSRSRADTVWQRTIEWKK